MKLLEEQTIHNDLLQINYLERSKNMVIKSLGFLQWAVSNGNFLFIAKTEVDSFWNISSVLQGLESIGKPDEFASIPTIYGTLVKDIFAPGWGFRRIPATFCCKKNMFPDYHSGGELVQVARLTTSHLSSNTVQILFKL